MPKTIFILAGEASGDAHAAKLVTQLKAQSPGIRCVGMGGAKMIAAGFEAFKNLDGMQVVGFWEVAKQYGFFKRVFYELLGKLKENRPDALVCIDYPGFNLRFAEEVKKLGIPVFYYIVPQVWAWKPQRAKKMAKNVTKAFCVFDFEPPFFQKYGLETEFVGHPLVDHSPGEIDGPPDWTGAGNTWTVSLLPGSRNSEIQQHLKPMIDGFLLARKRRPGLRALVSIPEQFAKDSVALKPLEDAGAERIGPAGGRQIGVIWAKDDDKKYLGERLTQYNAMPMSHARMLAKLADFSVVKSGTSTLEAGLSRTPMCALYKGSAVSFMIARMLVNIPVFSLVNIVMGRYVVPELLQSEVNAQRIAAEIERGVFDGEYAIAQRKALWELPAKLGGAGAAQRAAAGILKAMGV